MAMRKGFTLVELLIVMAILAMMTVILIGILNPKALIDRAYDAQRKKDLARIKVAFEEYFNDKGCYPTEAVIDGLTCKESGFASWGLNSWPCDPVTKQPYLVMVGKGAVDGGNCPDWYKIYTKLENKSDIDIPAGLNGAYPGVVAIDVGASVNYGVSSPNVSWKGVMLQPGCERILHRCYYLNPEGYFLPHNSDDNVEYKDSYTVGDRKCLVPCCVNGFLCQ
jgi:prepilin-type N-terminal cleavage/methylation domain-containing protein